MKRVLLMVTIVLMVFGMIAGCSGNNNNVVAPQETPQQSEKPTPTPTPTPTPEPPKERPKITIAIGTEGNKYIEGLANINEDEITKKIRELSGIDITYELIPNTEYDNNLTLLMAGGDIPDILQSHGLNNSNMIPAVENGVLLPLDDLLQQHGSNLLKGFDPSIWKAPKISANGKIYAVPDLNVIPNGRVIMIRGDWLEKLKLEVPRTIDEYIKVMEAFRDGDPNGNGKADEIPFISREKLSYGEAFFGAYNVLPNTWRVLNGQLVPSYTMPEMEEALTLYQRLYKDKLLDNETFVNNGTDYADKIRGAGLVGIWTAGALDAAAWQQLFHDNGHTDAIVKSIPAPTGPDGKGGFFIRSPLSVNVYSIPVKSKNPEVAMQYLNWLYSDEAREFFTWGPQGKDNFKFPTDPDEVTKHFAISNFFRMIGPQKYENADYMQHEPNGSMIAEAVAIANSEGREMNNIDMPVLPARTANPDLSSELFNQFAAEVVTGKKSPTEFNNFVADWKKRGGEQYIIEATEWYNSKK